MTEFVKARGLSSLSYGIQYLNTSEKEFLKECIYEASMIEEDPSEFFKLLSVENDI